MQFTFRVEDLLNLIASNTNSSQVVVKMDPESKKRYTARMRPEGETLTDSDEPPMEIDGCPFPPGCTP